MFIYHCILLCIVYYCRETSDGWRTLSVVVTDTRGCNYRPIINQNLIPCGPGSIRGAEPRSNLLHHIPRLHQYYTLYLQLQLSDDLGKQLSSIPGNIYIFHSPFLLDLNLLNPLRGFSS